MCIIAQLHVDFYRIYQVGPTTFKIYRSMYFIVSRSTVDNNVEENGFEDP